MTSSTSRGKEFSKWFWSIWSKNNTKNFNGDYIFESMKSNRALIAIGFVNSPGKSKVFHIKELEYIIEKYTNVNQEQTIEMIDIGGITLLRSSAKNFNFVTSICDNKFYDQLIR